MGNTDRGGVWPGTRRAAERRRERSTPRRHAADGPDFRTVVLGGGVAGLGLAHGLAARSLGVEVVERHEPSVDEGFGFLLMPNGSRALTTLGAAFDPREVGVELRRAIIRTSDGAPVSDTPLDGVIGITRHALLSRLRESLDRVSPGSVHFGVGFRRFEWDAARARAAEFDDGSTRAAELFCGADGIRSACRSAIVPMPELRAGRVKEVVAVAEDASLAAEVGDAFMKFVHPDGGLAVGLVPTGAGRLVWFVQFDAVRFEAPAAGSQEQFVAERLVGFPDLVREVVAATRPGTMHTWHTVDVDPVDSMAVANVALVGDAAHPLLPFTSQGANSALDDAAALVGAIERVAAGRDRLDDALRRYDVARRPDAVRFVAAGRHLATEFVRPPERSFALPLAT